MDIKIQKKKFRYPEPVENTKNPVRDGFTRYSRGANSRIFPPPAVLESYEEICPGIVEKLAVLVEREQKHRHMLLTKKNRETGCFLCMKYLSSGVTAVAVICATTYLILQDKMIAATALGIVGFLLIVIMSVFQNTKKNRVNISPATRFPNTNRTQRPKRYP